MIGQRGCEYSACLDHVPRRGHAAGRERPLGAPTGLAGQPRHLGGNGLHLIGPPVAMQDDIAAGGQCRARPGARESPVNTSR